MYVQICNAPISLPFIQSYSVPLTCMYKYAVRRYHYRLYNHTVCHSHVCTNMQCADITTVYTIIQCATHMYVQICSAPISLPFIQSYSVPLTCMNNYAVRRCDYRLYNHTVCHSHVCTNMQCADITTVYTIIQCATRMHEQLCSAPISLPFIQSYSVPLTCMYKYAVRRYHYRLYNHTVRHSHAWTTMQCAPPMHEQLCSAPISLPFIQSYNVPLTRGKRRGRCRMWRSTDKTAADTPATRGHAAYVQPSVLNIHYISIYHLHIYILKAV